MSQGLESSLPSLRILQHLRPVDYFLMFFNLGVIVSLGILFMAGLTIIHPKLGSLVPFHSILSLNALEIITLLLLILTSTSLIIITQALLLMLHEIAHFLVARWKQIHIRHILVIEKKGFFLLVEPSIMGLDLYDDLIFKTSGFFGSLVGSLFIFLIYELLNLLITRNDVLNLISWLKMTLLSLINLNATISSTSEYWFIIIFHASSTYLLVTVFRHLINDFRVKETNDLGFIMRRWFPNITKNPIIWNFKKKLDTTVVWLACFLILVCPPLILYHFDLTFIIIYFTVHIINTSFGLFGGSSTVHVLVGNVLKKIFGKSTIVVS